MNSTVSVTGARQRKSNWLPLLVFLFVVSCGLLTTLVIFQDRIIDAQADLIHLLFKEGRLKAISASAKQQAPPKQHATQSAVNSQASSSQHSAGPNNEAPSAQARLNQKVAQVPSSQKKPQAGARPDRNQHNSGKRSPFRPPAEMTDPSDMRRTLFSI
jgi:hypothetical protein